jgi:beta-glucosidase
VVDVNNNPDNPAINIRAFGDRPEVVADLTTAFIQGAKSTAVLTTAKHFPGHGDTSTDSHLDLPALNHSESRLAEVELPPFEQAIAVGVDSVMTAHLLISAWDTELPATLSKKIVTEILRNRLGFFGLVVTDALIMGGITRYAPPETVAVMAIEAGTDILLMPDNPEVAIASIYDAVQTGRIKESRIQESLERIWQAKQQVFANSTTATDITRELSSDRARSAVNSILQNSLQQSEISIIISPQSSGRNLVVVDDVLNTTYLDINSPAITIPQKYNYQRQLLDSNTLDCILLDSRPTLLQVFIRGNPFRGNAGLTAKTKAIYQKLLANQQVVGIVIYGSPYVLEWFKSMIESDLPWVFTYGQMNQAQAIALEALFTKSEEASSSYGGVSLTNNSQAQEFQTHNFGF